MSLQPTGKSKTIPSLEIDYEALGKEINAADKARNTREQKPTRVAKQTSGTLYANGSNPYSINKQQMINFLNGQETPAPESTPVENVDHRQAATPASYESRKLDNNPHLTGKSIMRSGGGIDNDGATPYRRNSNSEMINSIWDSEKIHRMSNELASTPGEQISQNKEDRQSVLKQLESERRDQLADALEAGVEQRKDSHVTHTGGSGEHASQYKMPKRNMSIFDTDSFEAFASQHQTDGEKMSEAKRQARADMDKTVPNTGRIVSSKGVLNRLWDALSQEGQDA